MAEILCPYCFETFKSKDAKCVCQNHSMDMSGNYRCAHEMHVEYNNFWGMEEMTGHIFPSKTSLFKSYPEIQKQKCDQCGGIHVDFVCPHCLNRLPRQIIENGSEIISVIGGPYSGKTNYIVTLMEWIKRYGSKIDMSVFPQQMCRHGHNDEQTTNLFRSKRDSLFEERTIVDKTPEQEIAIPWIFELKQRKSNGKFKSVYLVFYDTAGESFFDPDSMQSYAKYFKHSKGIITLLDTFSVRQIRKMLEAKGLALDAAHSIEETMSTLNNYINESGMKTDKPLAVVLSKFDYVIDNSRELGNLNVSPFKDADGLIDSEFLTHKHLDLDKVNEIHETLKEYLEFCEKDGDVSGVMSTFRNNSKLFAVSSFGQAPKGVMLENDMAPYRVLDPLLWILYKIGDFDIPTVGNSK